ncbi:unnamed protein product [Arabidopsis halleri]
MANNRAHVLPKEVTAPEEEESSNSWIGKALAEQNAKIEKHTMEMFAAIRMISEKVDNIVNSDSISQYSPTSPVEIKQEPRVFNVEVPRRARSGPQSHYSGVTRLAKLDFPRFGGDRVRDWLFKVEQFFSLDCTPDDFKVRMCSIHFDGPAEAWHQSLYESDLGTKVMNDWIGYKKLLLERFDEVLDDPMAELKRLQETNGIKEYHERFEVIRLRLKLPEDYLVSAYLAGLRTDTQMHIRMFQPTTIRQCLMLGKLYEQAHPTNNGGAKPTVNNGSKWSGSANSQFKGVLAAKPDWAQKSAPQVNSFKPKEQGMQPRKFLSTEEMNRRRSQGLCYFCDEKYSPEHYLTHKKKQLYMMDVEECESEETVDYHSADEGDSEVNQEHAQVSVSAVSGVSDYRTMKVRGYAGKQALIKEPERVLERKMVNRQGRAATMVLVVSGDSNNGDDSRTESYMAYALSVLLGRALPDVRDGLKPVHRRILLSVLGKFHPHGVYGSLVRMAQSFSLRCPLIQGHGNFGSIDADPAAAMRYTECRLDPLAEAVLLADLDQDTVDFVPNFDNSQKEPTVLPARLPALLLNGASGIAVGMATNIPPHNLGELVDVLCALIHNPEATLQELLEYMPPAPDFPTGGTIMGNLGLVFFFFLVRTLG